MENTVSIHKLILDTLERIEVLLLEIKAPTLPETDRNGVNTKEYLDVANTAEFLYCSKPYVYELKHRIPHILRGGRLYFKKTDLQHYLDSGRVNPDPGKIRKKKRMSAV
jgi:hypothetical protein